MKPRKLTFELNNLKDRYVTDLPYIEIKNLKIMIDSGANCNLIHPEAAKNLKQYFENNYLNYLGQQIKIKKYTIMKIGKVGINF